MKSYPFDKKLSDELGILNFYIDAIQYRNSHKQESTDIAEHVFNATHPSLSLSFTVSPNLDQLRNEFGALEAPGMPEDDNKDPDEYVDELWLRLLDMIEKQKKWTV